MLVTYLTVSIPLAGRTVPVLGIGDLLFLAAYFAALRRSGYWALVAFAVPVAGLLVALGVGLAVGGVFGIPFMAAAVVAWVWRTGRRAGKPSS